MLDAFAVLLYELGDGAVVSGGLQELQLAVAAGQEGHGDLLLLNGLGALGLEAQGVLVELYHFVKVLDGDTNVIYTSSVNHDIRFPFL